MQTSIFYKKYLKYKNKYNSLKNQYGGDKIQCPSLTLNYGILVDDLKDCDKLDLEGSIDLSKIDPTEISEAASKGYDTKYMHNNCYIKQSFPNPTTINICLDGKPLNKFDDIKIATFNIMGIDKSQVQINLIDKRMNMISDLIKNNSIDIVCFQEMSYSTQIRLVKLLAEYNFYEKIDENKYKFEQKGKLYEGRYHNIECTVAIKKNLSPTKIKIEPIGGNANYTNSLMTIEFSNLIIYNCYLQAGTKHSVGLKNMYIHYTRCRQQLLTYLINKLDLTKPTIILGDFNIDLNDDGTDFPDIAYIDHLKKIGFNDVWQTLNPTNQTDPHVKEAGLTENTSTNLMRWNDKFINKKARVDGIFVRGLRPIECILLGNQNYLLIDSDTDDYEMEFLLNFTKAKGNSQHKDLKKINNKLPIFASDHYGVLATLRF